MSMTQQQRREIATVTVVQTAFLGDVLLTLPMIAELKSAMPWARVRLVTTPAAATFVTDLALADEVIAFDKRGSDAGWKGIKAFARSLRCPAHAVIVPHRSLRTAVLVREMQATWSCTVRTAWSRWVCTQSIPYPSVLHDADRHLRLAAVLTGVVKTKEDVGKIELCTPSDLEAVHHLLHEHGVRKPYVVVAPGSVWPTKRWSQRHGAALVQTLADRNDTVVVLGETSLADAFPKREQVIDLRGKTTFREAAAVINGASVVVCNDSSPLHLATLQHVPVVAVFGPTVPEFGFGPYGPRARVVEETALSCRPCSPHGTASCPLGTHACMESIEPIRILNAMNEIVETV